MTSNQPLVMPTHCPIAFKEWQGVCEALADGRQSLILRKGGIAEDPAGFIPEHPAFWLYPTLVHQAEQGLKQASSNPPPPHPEGIVTLHSLAIVNLIARVERLDRLLALDPFHVWTQETIEKRFHYRSPGLWVLGVRIFRAQHPIPIAVTPDHAGCKTWVPLHPAPPTLHLVPALDPEIFEHRMNLLRQILESNSTTH